MNVADSELVAAILEREKHRITNNISEADVIIFNTCSVREHAENRVLGRISNEMARKRHNPELKIGVIGCMAQRLGNSLFQMNKNIDFVVGVDQYKKLPEIISQAEKNNSRSNTDFNPNEIYSSIQSHHYGKFNAFVTIMRGCNNFCSYCIVPYTRGRERSRPVQDILNEIEFLGKKGFKDITLLGQNVNSYNFQKTNFAELLYLANKIDTIKRLRFVTSHPKDLSDEVIDAMANSSKVCEHLHLALQSGNDEILKKMNRGYSAEQFFQIIEHLRAKMPEIAITTDVIAGFPGETERQFEDTIELLKKIRFDYAFTFKYSPRAGTKAAEFPDHIPENIRLERLQRLIKLQENITLEKYQQQIGKTKEIYVEKISKKSKLEVSGKSRDFKITVFPGSKNLIEKFVNVKITSATGWTLRGERFD